MPGYTTTVGAVELLSLNDGMPTRSPFAPFPDTTIEQWREFPELLDQHEQITSRYGTTGVRSQGKLIIVDTGLQAPDGTLMTDMRAKGVDAEAVDLVVFTHLHPDHVGWNLTGGKPNFPKRPLSGAPQGLGLLDSTRRPVRRHPRSRPGGPPGRPGLH